LRRREFIAGLGGAAAWPVIARAQGPVPLVRFLSDQSPDFFADGMRGFLAWDRRDLAQKAVVTVYAIERIESDGEISGAAMSKTLSAVRGALEAEGVGFTDDAGVLGVRLRSKGKTRAKGRKNDRDLQ
jgi:hypothetical protein